MTGYEKDIVSKILAEYYGEFKDKSGYIKKTRNKKKTLQGLTNSLKSLL